MARVGERLRARVGKTLEYPGCIVDRSGDVSLIHKLSETDIYNYILQEYETAKPKSYMRTTILRACLAEDLRFIEDQHKYSSLKTFQFGFFSHDSHCFLLCLMH